MMRFKIFRGLVFAFSFLCCSAFASYQQDTATLRPELLDTIDYYTENSASEPDTVAAAPAEEAEAEATVEPVTYYVKNDSSKINYENGNEKKYEELKEGIDYSKEVYNERNIKPLKLNLNEGIVKTIAISIILLVILFVVYQLFKNARANKKVNSSLRAQTNLLDDAAENLDKVDLEQLLADALERKDYKAALRIYYLKILKTMWDKNILRWKKEKTNGDYLSEVFGGEWYEQLKTSTYLFEKCWYGNAVVDAELFETASNHFKMVLNKLQS